MTRPKREITADGRTWCSFHACLEPAEDFNWTSYESGDGTVARLPKGQCRLAEQTVRDQGKDSDPARFAIEGRAKDFSRALSRALGRTIGYKFVLIELNWQALIPIMRALLAADGLCLNCGKHRATARELHIEHRVPPDSLTDRATQHARNLWIACGGCNVEKGRRESDRSWLEREQRKWMLARKWAERAGAKGWPVYEMTFGEVPLPGFAGDVSPQMTIDDFL